MVLIFGKDGCPYTQGARDHYAAGNVPFQYFNVKKNPIKYIMETSEHYYPMAHGSQNPRLRYLIKELQKEQNKFLG